MVTVWITKYVFTKGIQKEAGCVVDDKDSGRPYVKRGRYGDDNYILMALGRDAFLSETEAKANAVKRCQNKLKSIDKERKKVEALLTECK